MILPRSKMAYLIQRIRQRFKAAIGELPTRSKQFFGYGDYDTGQPNLPLWMSDLPAVRIELQKRNEGLERNQTAYRSIRGKKLYNIDREIRKGIKREFPLDAFHARIYLLAAGFEDESELEAAYLKEHPRTEFDGYYYSPRKHQIKGFKLEFDFSTTPYTVWETGIHDHPGQPVYQGTATRQGPHLYMELRREGGADRLTIYAHLDKLDLPDREVTPCAFMAISAYAGNIIHAEAVLIRGDLPGAAKEAETKIGLLQKYLFLQRSNYRLASYEYPELEDLRVGNAPVETIDFIIGTHRVWGFGPDGAIVQSKLVVDPDYRAHLHSELYRKNQAKQIVRMSISGVINKRVCISTHSRKDPDVINFCILEIPPKGQQFIKGVQCHVGLENGPMRSGYLMLVKCSSEIKPRIIPREDISNYIGEDEQLQELHRRLAGWQGA